MTRPSSPLLKIAALAGGTALLASTPLALPAQSISGITPAPVRADSVTEITLAGSGLLSLNSFLIRKGTRAPLPLDITSQTDTAVTGRIDLRTEPVGLYDLIASGPAVPTITQLRAFEITRPDSLLITGSTATASLFPLFSGRAQTNTEFILLQSDFGRPIKPYKVRLYLEPGAPSVTGNIVIRVKHTTLTSFPDTQLENTGWTVLRNVAIPAADPAGFIEVPFSVLWAYDGVQNMMVSIILETTTPAYGLHLTTFDTGADRLRTGYTTINLQPATQWSGTYPTTRVMEQGVPKVEFFSTDLYITAHFSASSQNVPVGTPVTFTNTSTPGVYGTWEWDFDGDGITDSTAASPTHSYSTAGVYTVELVNTNRFPQDAETKVNHITVTGGSAVDWTLVEME